MTVGLHRWRGNTPNHSNTCLGWGSSLDSANQPKRQSYKPVILAILIFCGLVLVFTLVGVMAAPNSAQIGGTRPTDTIPTHLLELAGVGLILGAGLAVAYGRDGLPLAVLMPVLTVMLDLDHLPIYLGIAQTVRPAHSVVFIVTVLAVTAITIKSLEVDLVVLSATLAHMGIDTGIFAPFSPLNFDYYQLDPYRVPFLAGAVLTALAGGLLLRRQRLRTQPVGKELIQTASF